VEIINPFYKVDEENNVFNIRKKEYDLLEEKIRKIVSPVEEIGFTISEFGFKESKFTSGELQRTLKRNLIIRLRKDTTDIDLSMVIPKLIDRNYIMIGGRKKVPLFQLFDIPIVTRGKNIKIRTNVCSMMILEEKEFPFIELSIFNKKVPLSLVFFAYFGVDETEKRFNLSKLELSDEPKTIYEKFIYDLKDFYDGSAGYTKEDFIKDVGQHFSQYDPKVKGEELIYALDLILKVDIMSAPFFSTGNILDEILNVLKNGDIDDTDLRNKRIRCFEYVILGRISKTIFDFCIANRVSRNPKFNINSTQILSDCNVSDIIQFDFSINPIEELTKLTRTSLVGPNGFNRENVPEYLRDIMPSMFGRICPVDTPDRDNCGVLQSILPNVKLDDNLRFTDDSLVKTPISIPVSFVPFLEHDDQTRLQMASSQMRQAIMLLDPDNPMIQSGCENLYTKYSQFIKIARKKGIVAYVDSNIILIVYEDNDFDIFEINNRKIYVENTDMMVVYVEKGDKVNPGDIVAASNFCKNGNITIGKNLLTAVTPYYGYNYEDAIVISDRLTNDEMFTSVHYIDLSFKIPPDKVLLSLEKNYYKPLPNPDTSIKVIETKEDYNKRYDCITPDKPYAILKQIPSNPLDYNSIFEEEIPLYSKKVVLVSEVTIYPNLWNESIPAYNEWINETLNKQKEQEKKLQNILYEFLPKEKASEYIKDKNLNKFSSNKKFKIKGETINGVFVEMYGLYWRQIKIGDKIGNRHGNKGVISKIIPHEKMPELEDGRHVDICINPLGIISRMNIGQIFELGLSASLYDLKKMLSEKILNNKSQDEIKKFILGYIKIIDNTENNWYYNQFKEQLENIIIDNKFVNELCLLQPPFESSTKDMILKACEYTKTKLRHKLYDPIENITIENKIATGYMYFFRMVHIAESRLAARGIGWYTKRTMQPPGGRKNRGGQRCGEMETSCFIGHDGLENLHEVLTTKSDCIDLKNKYIKKTIGSEFMKEQEDESIVPESVKVMNNYFKVIGIEP